MPLCPIGFLKSASCKVAVLLLLSLGTILFFNLYEQYTVIGTELLRNAGFGGQLEGWTHSSQGVSALAPVEDAVRLHADAPARFVHISQRLPAVQHAALLRLAYDTKTDQVSPGQARWMSARIVLISPGPAGPSVSLHTYVLTNLTGTHDWEHHAVVFATAANPYGLSVSAQLAQASGTLWIRNPSLLPVKQVESFRALRLCAAVLWAVAILWIALPITRSALGNARRTVIVSLAFAIALGALMPEKLKLRIGDLLSASAAAGAPPTIHSEEALFKFSPLWPSPDLYKAGHFVLFALLSVAAYARRPYPIPRSRIAGYLLLFALTTEVLQLLVAGRSAQLGDLMIDGAGIVLGLLFVLAIDAYVPSGRA